MDSRKCKACEIKPQKNDKKSDSKESANAKEKNFPKKIDPQKGRQKTRREKSEEKTRSKESENPNRRLQVEQRSICRGAISKLHQAQIWKNENLWVFQNLPSRTSRENLLGQQEQNQMYVKRSSRKLEDAKSICCEN
jgi:hypothetical protein